MSHLALGSHGRLGGFVIALLAGCIDGSSNTRSNTPPTASFTVACTDLTCQLTDGSVDPDGTIAARSWAFGDGAGSSETNPAHTYGAPGGQFTVTLTVTDDDGDTATAQTPVTVPALDPCVWVPPYPAPDPGPGTVYERETPHSASDRHSSYVLFDDYTFELHDTALEVLRGRWVPVAFVNSLPVEPGAYVQFYFYGMPVGWFCQGQAFGSFLFGDHLGIAHSLEGYQAGIEEGVYTSGPVIDPPVTPPPQPGQIAFVRDGRIYLANTDGTGVMPLSDGPNDFYPAWSPDGSRIAFTMFTSGTGAIFVMDADGSNVIQRAAGVRPSWSPDGDWIAFGSVDGHSVRKVKADDDGTPSVSVYGSAGQLAYPAWSPDGTQIAFISDEALPDIFFDLWVVAPDGSQPTALRTHGPAGANADGQWLPAWSPDGQRIALVECPWAFFLCSSSAITVINADGSGVVRLAVGGGFGGGPTWSPDGQLIAFRSPADAIEWISADGSQRGLIVADGRSPAWRP